MPEEERVAIRGFLKLASERGKFAIPIGMVFTAAEDRAMDALLLSGWIRLIDVSPLRAHHPSNGANLYRIFLASDEAMTWLRRTS